jgi:hypothetical protein
MVAVGVGLGVYFWRRRGDLPTDEINLTPPAVAAT